MCVSEKLSLLSHNKQLITILDSILLNLSIKKKSN